MGDKSEAITEAKRLEEQIKQEQLHEKQEEKAQEKKAEVKAEERKAEVNVEPKLEGRKEEKPAEKNEAGKPAEKKEEKKAEKPAEKKDEKKKDARKFVLERIYSIPLRKAFRKPRSHRARVAVSLLKQFVARHAKAGGTENVYVNPEVNSLVLERGARNPPKLVKVLVQKDDAGRVFVGLPGK